MIKRLPIFVASLAVTFAACGTQYAFPLKAPSSETLDTSYKAWKHELSENTNYHFSILIPQDWQILQTSVAKKPDGSKPLEVAMFREPGAWMEDPSIAQEGEIVVEVFTTSGSLNTGGLKTKAPMDWLKKKLQTGVGSFKTLNERRFDGPSGPVADLLAKSGAGDMTLISRFAAFHSPTNPDEIFVIASSATEEGYARVAEAFATAIDTLRLKNGGKAVTGN